ncbi:hypothetical protein ACHAXR_004822 [Thalassiosira sp. AJA248-18]
MTPSKADDDDSCSIDSDVAFSFVDFSGVDFGDDDDEPTDKMAPDESHQGKCSKKEDIREKYEKQKDQGAQQLIEIPDGQVLQERHIHDPQLFKAQTRRVQNLCKWHELGIRPSLSSASLLNIAAHRHKDDDLFACEDDLEMLLLRSLQAQDDLNTNLPPHPLGEYEDSLKVAPSTIPDAGKGLFATSHIPKGVNVCYYTGYRHHYQSQKRLKNREYILNLQNDGFVDPFPTKDVLARFINDPKNEDQCNVKFEYIEEPGIWYCPVVAQRDIAAGEEVFISYGPRYWSESRTIKG